VAATPPRRGIHATVARIVDHLRVVDAEVARKYPKEWLDAHGPRVMNLKDGMIVIHTGHQELMLRGFKGLEQAVRDRSELSVVERNLVELAARALKVALDVQQVLTEADLARVAAGAASLEDDDEELPALRAAA
jgi:hypothetical protein